MKIYGLCEDCEHFEMGSCLYEFDTAELEGGTAAIERLYEIGLNNLSVDVQIIKCLNFVRKNV